MKYLVYDTVGQVKLISTRRGIDTSKPDSARANVAILAEADRSQPVKSIKRIRCGEDDIIVILRDRVSPSPSSTILEFHILQQESKPRLELKYTTAVVGKCVGAELDGRALQTIFEDGTIELRVIPESFPATPDKFWGKDGPNRRTFNFGKGITVCRLLQSSVATDLSAQHILAVGGASPDREKNGRDLELFRSSTSDGTYTSIWKAKNVKQNAMKLAVPIGVSQIEFAPGCPPPQSETINYLVVVGTSWGHLRAYGTTKSRRPVKTWEVSKEAIVQMKVLPWTVPSTERLEKTAQEFEFSVAISDTKGMMSEFSVASGNPIGNFAGSAGEVAGVTAWSQGIATVAYDRYLRVYEERKMVSKVYWAGRGIGVVVVEEEDEIVEEEKGSDDEDNVWDEMEIAEEGSRGKRKGRGEGEGRKKARRE